MTRKVSLYSVFFLVLFLLLGTSGCIEEGGSVRYTSSEPGAELAEGGAAGLRPEKYWEETWKILEKNSLLETDGDQVILNACCLIEYLGADPVTDVQIMMRSPLSEKLIGEDSVQNFGKISPGEKIEYKTSLVYPAWQEALTAGCSAENFVEDYIMNYYIDVAWGESEQKYNVQFFDWSAEFPVC